MTEGNENTVPVRDFAYLESHPEEVTVDDLDARDEQGKKTYGNFLNNFSLRIAQRGMVTKVESGQKMQDAMRKAMQEIGFDEKEFDMNHERILDLVEKRVDLFRQRKTLGEEAYARETQKIDDENELLIRKEKETILPLYKKMRSLGFAHYPDLTA